MHAWYNVALLNKIKDKLIEKGQTVAVAESVTAGFLQAGFSQAKDAMKFYQGGITAYNLGQKSKHFNIDPIHALNCNCVSERVSSEMADKVAVAFASDWGIAITGYASPDPEKGVEQLFAFYSFYYRGKNMGTEKIESKTMEVAEVQLFYVNHIYDRFYDILKVYDKA